MVILACRPRRREGTVKEIDELELEVRQADPQKVTKIEEESNGANPLGTSNVI